MNFVGSPVSLPAGTYLFLNNNNKKKNPDFNWGSAKQTLLRAGSFFIHRECRRVWSMPSSCKSLRCAAAKRKSALRPQQQYLQARFAAPTGLHLNEIKLIRLAHLNVKLRLLPEPGRFCEERAIPVHLEERQETLTIR